MVTDRTVFPGRPVSATRVRDLGRRLGELFVATKPGGVSPYTSTGLVGNEWPIKPDVVFEGE